MSNNYYVYIYTRLDNNTMFYVGKGKDDRYKNMNNRNNHFLNIVNKVDYKVEILYDNLTEQQALNLEKDTIHCLVFEEGYGIDIEGYTKPNEIKHLCNQTWGGEGISGWTHTEESRKKMSESHMGKECGELNHFYGKTHTEESRKKISEKLMGNCNMFGKHHTEETKNKISESRKGKYCGENNPSYGIPKSEETKNKISKNRKGKYCGENHYMATAVICITTKTIFNSIIDASKFYNIKSSSHIGGCCRGERKSCGKYQGKKLVWRYLNHKHNITLRGKDISKLHKNREVA